MEKLLKAVAIRAAKTWCQAFIACTGVTGAGRGLADIDWKLALSVATAAAIIAFVWNLGTGLPEVNLKETLDEYDEYEASTHDEDDDEDEDDEEEGEE